MDSLQRKGINFDLNTEAKAMAVIYQMIKEFPWLNYCVNVCTISDVPKLFDISHVFARKAERLEKKNAWFDKIFPICYIHLKQKKGVAERLERGGFVTDNRYREIPVANEIARLLLWQRS